MPYIAFDNTKKNKGSVTGLVNYLEKENKGKQEEYFFNHDDDQIEKKEVINAIDNNNKKLSKKEEKYYSFIVAPSQKELEGVLKSKKDLKGYIKKVMDLYASNFNKDIIGKDLLYFAKIEKERSFKNRDFEVKQGFAKQYEKKEGNQTHIHIVVSRRAKNNGQRLSPKDRAKGGTHFKLPNGTTISRGFNMNQFKNKAEATFDDFFEYKRELEEKYEYLRLQKHHPKEFIKKYGAEEFSLSVDTRSVRDGVGEKEYLQKRIEEAVHSGSNKKEVDKQLRQKGININKEKVVFNNKETPIKEFKGLLSKDVMELIGLYYVMKKTSKLFKGEQEQEKEFNEE